MEDFSKHLVQTHESIRDALEKLNDLGNYLTLFVLNENSILVGTITDGDIRRAILKGITIDQKIENVMNTKYSFLLKNYNEIEQLQAIRQKNVKLIPVIDESGKILRLINLEKIKSILPIDAVIMAGGEGRRLRPLTDELPKPLLNVGSKPIIEYNIDRLRDYGVENCYITIKYLGNKIRDYFGDGREKNINIKYIEETGSPLGTIGSARLIDHFDHDTILVMNSDLLTNIDFEDYYLEFIKSGADMAVATIPYIVKVPYAVLETDQQVITGFNEKPTYTYFSNAGIYLLKKEIIQTIIPRDIFYNATDLMDTLIKTGKKVITYPLFCYWLDIGKPEDYQKAQEDIRHIRF
jgi:dTDP-glucose pyrophosphorylase